MSVEALTWVLTHSEATLGARLVLIAIANHANNAGEHSWQSVETLSRSARLSERQTRYALRKLEELGEIEKVGRTRHGTHVYRLPKMAQQVLSDRGADSAGADIAPGQSATGGGQSTTRTHEETAPDSSREPSREPSRGRGKPRRRERNLAHDALARATGKNPKALTPREAEKLGVALADIVAGERERLGVAEISPEELARTIQRASVRFRRLHPTWECTPFSLSDHWSELFAEERRPASPTDGHAFTPAANPELCAACGEAEYRHTRSLAEQREDRDAAAELAAHARVAVEGAATAAHEVSA
jgi:hypothetical protein